MEGTNIHIRELAHRVVCGGLRTETAATAVRRTVKTKSITLSLRPQIPAHTHTDFTSPLHLVLSQDESANRYKKEARARLQMMGLISDVPAVLGGWCVCVLFLVFGASGNNNTMRIGIQTNIFTLEVLSFNCIS